MALYISTPVGTKAGDVEIRKRLLEKTLPDYKFKGMEIWMRGKSPENPGEVMKTFEDVLGANYADDYFLTVQARRTDPDGDGDKFNPSNYFDLTTQRGADNLLANAKAAKKIGARALVAAPWIGVFRYSPNDYSIMNDNPDYRSSRVKHAIKQAKEVSKNVGIRVALEHPTVPLYGDFNSGVKNSMFDLGFGLFEHTSQVPGDMLVLDTCHVESARNIVSRIEKEPSFFVPGVMNAKAQPTMLEAVVRAKPFEVHYAGFGGEWNPYSTNPSTHIEGSVPGGLNDIIGEKIFRDLTKHLSTRAMEKDFMLERHFKNPSDEEDVVIVAEPNDNDFMNPVNAEETLRKICNWVRG